MGTASDSGTRSAVRQWLVWWLLWWTNGPVSTYDYPPQRFWSCLRGTNSPNPFSEGANIDCDKGDNRIKKDNERGGVVKRLQIVTQIVTPNSGFRIVFSKCTTCSQVSPCLGRKSSPRHRTEIPAVRTQLEKDHRTITLGMCQSSSLWRRQRTVVSSQRQLLFEMSVLKKLSCWETWCSVKYNKRSKYYTSLFLLVTCGPIMVSFFLLIYGPAKTSFLGKNYCLPLQAGKVLDFLLAGRREQMIIYFPSS